MKTRLGDGLILTIYRLIVRLYPRTFRERFGAWMVDDARELLRERREAGVTRWTGARRLLRDAARSLWAEWRHAGRDERRSWSGESRRPERASAPIQDLGYAARALGRDTKFTVGLGGLVGAGIAANAIAFAVVSAYLVRPLPYPESERLVSVEPTVPLTPSELEDVFEIPITWELDAFTLIGDPGAEMVLGSWVTSGYLEAFGVTPALGRSFRPDEAGGTASVALISHSLWQRRFGGDPDIIGRTVGAFTSDLPDEAEVFTIVGVLPAEAWFHHRFTDVFVPLRTENPTYMARLRTDVPAAAAAAIVEQRARAKMESVPADFSVRLTPVHERYVGAVRPFVRISTVAALLILLIAWGNAGILLLVRAQRRQREFTLRRALGAGRTRIAGQLLGEGMLLALGAGLVGIAIAAITLDQVGPWLELRVGRPVPGGVANLRLDGIALVGTLSLVLATGLVFGLCSLAGTLRPSLSSALADGGRGAGTSRGRRVARHALVSAEICLSLALLVAAGLTIRSARHLGRLDVGFQPEGLFAGNVILRRRSYESAEDRVAFHERLVAGLRDQPGVEAAAVAGQLPFLWGYVPSPMEAEGAASVVDGIVTSVGPRWVEAMGIGLVQGRDFGADERPGTEPAALVNRAMADQLWPNDGPLGKRVRPAPGPSDSPEDVDPWYRVVGVIDDMRTSLVTDIVPQLYVAASQSAPSSFFVVVRTRPGGATPEGMIEEVLRRLDPGIAVPTLTSVAEATAREARPARGLATLLAAFSIFAAALALLGLYGVVAYAATQARREVAIRIALGARSGTITDLYLRQGAGMITVGVALGLGGAWALSRLLAEQLHGVSPLDPATYAAVALLVATVGVLASWLPARRAARVDPMVVLRQE